MSFRNRKLTPLAIILLIFITAISIGPLFWIFISSFKTNREILASAYALPISWKPFGYIAALKLSPIFLFYRNSIIISFSATILNLLVVSMSSYITSRYKFKGKMFFTYSMASSLLIPTAALMMPIYIIWTHLGLYDSMLGLIIVYAALGLPTSFFVLRSSFIIIPKELEEAAYLDGASFITTFLKIMIPMVKSGIATAAILEFLTAWNEFMFALILTKSIDVRTLPLALSYFTSQFSYNYTAMFAGIIMVVLPSIVIYTILQEQVTSSMVAGSIKG
ncbi:MAG: carbohydrate ABC transporter permease [Spirochaetaceae bacterium]|nr:carbohydrate ABC transporter permease [Spirochaetaceae bacterium]